MLASTGMHLSVGCDPHDWLIRSGVEPNPGPSSADPLLQQPKQSSKTEDDQSTINAIFNNPWIKDKWNQRSKDSVHMSTEHNMLDGFLFLDELLLAMILHVQALSKKSVSEECAKEDSENAKYASTCAFRSISIDFLIYPTSDLSNPNVL